MRKEIYQNSLDINRESNDGCDMCYLDLTELTSLVGNF